jgi:cell division protein ZapA
MTIEINGTTVEVLGKSFQVKCPPDEVVSLQKAAEYLEGKMQEIKATTHLLSIDRIAVIAALNIAHQLLNLEHEKLGAGEKINSRLRELIDSMDNMLRKNSQLEFTPVK